MVTVNDKIFLKTVNPGQFLKVYLNQKTEVFR